MAPSSITRRGTRKHACPSGLVHGLSAVEMLCALVITLLLLGGSLPMMNDLRQGQRLHAAAALLETDIHFAKSESIRTGQTVRLVVQAPKGGGSCYMLHDGKADACDCSASGEARCDAGVQLLRVEGQAAGNGVTIDPLARTVVFDGRKGTITPTATLRVKARDGRALHQVVNVMGRVRTCSPGGAVGGVRACD